MRSTTCAAAGALQAVSTRARASFGAFSDAGNGYTYSQLIGAGKLKTVLGYGGHL
jgi:hypothetical protein